jgi:3',5'-cyclic AMP phosphodiesterase CpdA
VGSPFLLAQLSDLHLGAGWADRDPAAGLAAAVAAIRALPQQPDALLVTGDLADGASDAEYREVVELLAPLRVPVHVLPGNHDDRAALRRHFALPGADAEPVRYSVGLGPLQLVALDSTIPGADAGSLDSGQLAWLEQALAAEPQRPTVIAIHHPPIRTGVPAWDATRLSDRSRAALGELIARHGQVRLIVGGHLHRTITSELAGRPVLSVPSTYVQARLDFAGAEFQVADGPAGFALHVAFEGEVTSHIEAVGFRHA